MKLKQVKKQISKWKRDVRKWGYGRHTILDVEQSHRQIHELIMQQVPTAIGKVGSVELLGLKHWQRHANDAKALVTADGKRVCYKLYKTRESSPNRQPATPNSARPLSRVLRKWISSLHGF